MDTRSKIVDQVPIGDFDIVEGYFDPLLAPLALQIAMKKGSKPLVAVVRDPDEPLTPARARAEVVAALRAVDYVVIGGSLQGSWIAEDRDAFMNMIRAKHGR